MDTIRNIIRRLIRRDLKPSNTRRERLQAFRSDVISIDGATARIASPKEPRK